MTHQKLKHNMSDTIDSELELAKGKESQKSHSGKLRILSEEEIQLVEKLSASCTNQQIAEHLGISVAVFYKIKKRQHVVSIAYKKGKVKAIAHVAGKLMKLIDEGNVTATIFYLKTRGGWKEAKHTDTPDEEDDIYNDYDKNNSQKKIIIEFIDPPARNRE